MKKLLAAILLISLVLTGCACERNTEDPTPPNGNQPSSTERSFQNQEIEGLVISGMNISWTENESIFVAHIENTNDTAFNASIIKFRLLDENENDITDPAIMHFLDEPIGANDFDTVMNTISINVSRVRTIKIEIVR